MSRRPAFRPRLITLLALVVMVQSGVLFWVMVHPESRDEMLAGLRRTPVVGEVVEVCLPATLRV